MRSSKSITGELDEAIRSSVVSIWRIERLRHELRVAQCREQAKDPFVVALAQGGPAGGCAGEYGDGEGDE